MLDAVSLDQLRTFIAAAEEGSFSAAGRKLRRAQSVVSQTLANLEGQINTPLFDRSARYPQLTEAGKALLNEARTVVQGMDAFKARARTLVEGLEPELSVAIDVMFPMASLTEAVGSFSRRPQGHRPQPGPRKTCAAGADGSQQAQHGERLRRLLAVGLAPRRLGREACIPAGRVRLGPHAGRDGAAGPGCRPSGAHRDRGSPAPNTRHRDVCCLPDGRPARARRALVHRPTSTFWLTGPGLIRALTAGRRSSRWPRR